MRFCIKKAFRFYCIKKGGEIFSEDFSSVCFAAIVLFCTTSYLFLATTPLGCWMERLGLEIVAWLPVWSGRLFLGVLVCCGNRDVTGLPTFENTDDIGSVKGSNGFRFCSQFTMFSKFPAKQNYSWYRVWALYAPCSFCPLLKKIYRRQVLKCLNFLLRMPQWNKNKKILFYPISEHFWDTQYKNIFQY